MSPPSHPSSPLAAPAPRAYLSPLLSFSLQRTMAESGPSKSRILAALDLTEDDPSSSSPSPLPAAIQALLSRQAAPSQGGEKRKRGAEYASAVATPVNKRQVNGASRSLVNRLPSGLLANTQSPGAWCSFASVGLSCLWADAVHRTVRRCGH